MHPLFSSSVTNKIVDIENTFYRNKEIAVRAIGFRVVEQRNKPFFAVERVRNASYTLTYQCRHETNIKYELKKQIIIVRLNRHKQCCTTAPESRK